MKKSLYFAAVAALVALTSCSKDTVGTTNEEGGIEFRATIDKGAASRATTIEQTSDLTNFFISVNKSNEEGFGFLEAAVYNNGGTWTYAPKRYFPTDGATLNFFAYYPIKDLNMTTPLAIATDKTTTFGYTVPADQMKVRNTTNGTALAQDLLVANVQEQGVIDGDVELNFFHALSAATFSAENKYPATGISSELDYTIDTVKVVYLANLGTFTYDDFSAAVPADLTAAWAPDFTADKQVTYFAGLPEAGVSLKSGAGAKKLLTANDVMMLLPQEAGTLATKVEIAAAKVAYDAAYATEYEAVYTTEYAAARTEVLDAIGQAAYEAEPGDDAAKEAAKAAALADPANIAQANTIAAIEAVAVAQTAAVVKANEAGAAALSGKTYVEVSFSLEGGDGQYLYPVGSKIYLPLPTDFVFDAGTRYNFSFVFGGDSGSGGGEAALNDITFAVEVEDWVAPTTDPTPIPEP